MHSFAVCFVLDCRNLKWSTMTGRVRFTLPFTTIIERVSDSAPPSPWNLSAYWPWVAAMPSKPVRKSTCQKARRNSPSVMPCRPAASCIATARRISRSSTAFRFCAVILLLLKSCRAFFSSVGRNRLPTWSARNGGRCGARIRGSLQWEASLDYIPAATSLQLHPCSYIPAATSLLLRPGGQPPVRKPGPPLPHHRLHVVATVHAHAAAIVVDDLVAPAEIRGERRGRGVQPDIVAMDRDPAEDGVEQRNHAHHRQRAIEQGDGACEQRRARGPAPGRDAPGADQQVHGGMGDVH